MEQSISIDQVSGLFNAIPDVSFFVKDRQSRFVHVNDCFLRIHGFLSPSEMIGKQVLIFIRSRCDYFAEDNRVMNSAVYDQTELVTHHSGMPR